MRWSKSAKAPAVNRIAGRRRPNCTRASSRAARTAFPRSASTFLRRTIVAPFLGAGFYYKTFMWPASFWEKVYEPLIRRAAGLGALSRLTDPDTYEKATAHCDVLVIGAGPAGLQAARVAAHGGARVILADEDFALGGRLNGERMEIGSLAAQAWAARIVGELRSMDNVRILRRTTVFGVYDGATYGALEKVSDHLAAPPHHLPRQRLWRIIARRTILAAGAIERTIAFPDNDRPGIMQASAVRTYLNRFAVLPAKATAIFTCNHDGWRTAHDIIAAGGAVAAIIDTRPAEAIAELRAGVGDTPVFSRAHVVATQGRRQLAGVEVANATGGRLRVEADCLAVSGGWNPAVHLTCHRRGKPVWNDRIAGFVPGADTPARMRVVGAAAGELTTHGALTSATAAANAALGDLGMKSKAGSVPQAEDGPVEIQPILARRRQGPGLARFAERRHGQGCPPGVPAKASAPPNT